MAKWKISCLLFLFMFIAQRPAIAAPNLTAYILSPVDERWIFATDSFTFEAVILQLGASSRRQVYLCDLVIDDLYGQTFSAQTRVYMDPVSTDDRCIDPTTLLRRPACREVDFRVQLSPMALTVGIHYVTMHIRHLHQARTFARLYCFL